MAKKKVPIIFELKYSIQEPKEDRGKTWKAIIVAMSYESAVTQLERCVFLNAYAKYGEARKVVLNIEERQQLGELSSVAPDVTDYFLSK